MSEETREKIRQARKRQVMPPVSIETRKKMGEWQKGRHLSEETRKRISASKMGTCYMTEEKKKELAEKMRGNKYTLGMKFPNRHLPKPSKEARINMSKSHKGSKSYSWRGGVTPIHKLARKSLENKLWREAVFLRDNWTCQKCGVIGGELEPHHLTNFSLREDIRFSVNNGITLCKKCHHSFHNKYGKYDNNREQIIDWKVI